MADLIITGGQVVTPSGVGRWDVVVQGETIVAVTEPGAISTDGAKVIDASGKIVVPGGVEPHAHIGGARQPERSPAEPVSLAAIWGGTTTVLDFATQVPGHDLHHALDEAAERWQGNAYTDYSYHPIFTNGTSDDAINQIPELIQDGFASFKIFTTSIRPPSPQMQNNKTGFGTLASIMEKISASGGMLLVHSEDDDMVHFNYDHAKDRNQWDWWNMHHIHSNLSEDVSFHRVIRLAEKQACPVYFVHVSAAEGVRAVGWSRSRGLPIYGETLHNYACFSAENYREDNGMKYHTYPSLKSPEDANELWNGLLDGRLSTVATDLVSTTWEEKIRFKTVADVTGGHNGIETRVGVAFGEGVERRGMSLHRFVDITSANAAKIFGLYPRKGALAAGSDADITIIDPSIRRPLTSDDLHLEDYSIWEGWEAQGWPVTTVLRGKVMVEDRKLLASAGYGQLIARTIATEVTKRPVC
ncbi:MAG: amidohydrolase family protein [Chloroflexi bacterium]|nr:amidohydrolase family protein [Chloroflexota bacterium]MCH9039458.1 amidohydrolase family protein [Chloroflexota bacterium]MCI0791417.1 amidohydrolase family protein [Chloroflexota bacterium]MCI0796460.1 amidohydrolase family protein [Chloroflexota bacterium]MCI0813162.1 amidohydrolase family protein [Chloroflexota bacterium]